MLAFIADRLAQTALVLFGVTTLLFFMLRVAGDPVALVAGENATGEQVALVRQKLGFDDPLWLQYIRYVGGVLSLDFGESVLTRRDSLGMVWDALPNTLVLGGAALILGLALAFPIGIYAALRRDSVGSFLAMAMALFAQSLPSFWLGLMLILVFAVQLKWLPPFGNATPAHLVLPAVTLCTFITARHSRLIRSGMLEVLEQDYVRTARAKGVPGRLVIARHVLKNTLIPIVTVLGLDIAHLIGGAIVIETVFSWPGMGRQIIQAVNARDYPVVQATIFVVALVVVVANFAIDLIYRWLDPRISMA